jgi:pilus assembly protein CpaE
MHNSGVDVLVAPPDEESWERCTPDDLKTILDLLAQTYDFVVVDTTGSFDPIVRACVEVSTVTLVVTSGEVSSIRDTTAALHRLATWDVDPERLKVLLNRSSRVNGFSIDDLKESFGHEVFWIIPTDRSIPLSIQTGQPIMLDATSPAAQNLSDLARRIVGTRRFQGEPPGTGPLWRRILNRARGHA